MLNAYKFVKIGDPFSCGCTQNCIYVCTVKLCDIFENRGCAGDICAVYHLQSCSSFIVPIFRDKGPRCLCHPLSVFSFSP